MLYILNLVSANFKALSHCQIKLSFLLENEQETEDKVVHDKIGFFGNNDLKGYKYFMASFEETIVAIVEKGLYKNSIAEL